MIEGVKLNFNIDTSLQRYPQFQCLISLSKDFKQLNIVNKKPKDIPIFVQNEKNPTSEDHMKKLSHMESKMQILNTQKLYVANELIHLQQQKYAHEFYNDFDLKISSKSCKVDDIVNFVYGPFTSRFWIMRKHICLMNPRELNQLPFYAWDCISLTIRNGEDVFLLIKDEKDMTTFLTFLIFQMETIDG